MTDDGVPTPDGLGDKYEELRAAVVSGGACPAHGLALFCSKGMAAWMAAWRRLVEPMPFGMSATSSPGADDGVVNVLAAMAVALLNGA